MRQNTLLIVYHLLYRAHCVSGGVGWGPMGGMEVFLASYEFLSRRAI